jgi:two-component system alkaline phosphatase synthesis response regulator PhoP
MALAPWSSWSRQPTVLVVDDEESWRVAIESVLRQEGFQVILAKDAQEAREMIPKMEPEVILLDVILPGIQGIELCRSLRKQGLATPIVLVSGRSEEVDVVLGLEAGADDYISKPLRAHELLARVRNVLKHSTPLCNPRNKANSVAFPHERPARATQASEATNTKRAGGLVMDVESHEVSFQGRTVRLSPREAALLEVFMSNQNQVLTYQVLADRVLGWDFSGDIKTISTLVARLRNRLGEFTNGLDCSSLPAIETVRGLGYRLKVSKQPASLSEQGT